MATYVFTRYLGIWSRRVEGVDSMNGPFKDIDLTPTDWRIAEPYQWNVLRVREVVRDHETRLDMRPNGRGDVVTQTLPTDVIDSMVANLGEERANYLLEHKF